MKPIRRTQRFFNLNENASGKCITVDLQKNGIDNFANLPDKTLLWILIGLGLINLIKK